MEGGSACTNSIPWAVGQVDQGDDVLEVGPGYGATTDVFAELVADLTSVEIDPGLAAGLQRRYADSARVEVVQGDATALPFPNGRFTAAVCFSMLHHVPSLQSQDLLFAEVGRVLRAGAPLVALDSVESDNLREFHQGDTYEPIDPQTLPTRLAAVGFSESEVRVNEYAWTVLARRDPIGP